MTTTTIDPKTAHICQDAFLGCGDMRGAYARLETIPTSTNADTFLIRSHIAYHIGGKAAERATIKPSRGHTYRVTVVGITQDRGNIVIIRDHYDHRDGVVGIV